MLDINLFREDKGGKPDVIRESQRRRYSDPALVDKVIEHDQTWRSASNKVGSLRMEFNALNKQIGQLSKAKQDITELRKKSQTLKADIVKAEEEEKAAVVARENAVQAIGNLVHDSVPVDDNEDNNAVVKTWGEPRTDAELYNHVDLVKRLDIADLEKGVVVAGNRGYFLKGAGVLLNNALISYALQFAYQRDFTPLQTPFFMRKDIMAECAQLSQFDEELYKVTGEGEDKYLIATSEQPICAMHRKSWHEKNELPLKYCGYSTCFRKEAGSHGRDTLGIFRIHQFEKVEQFVVCSPYDNTSWQMLDEMVANAEAFYQSLELPYRVVNIVSGELNSAAAKKYDLEASFPASNAFRELVSCSNCTDYQSRRLDVRMRTAPQPNGETTKEFVHMLNGTLTATERTICCILENHQTPEGVKIPKVLQPFMMGIDFLPFKLELKKEESKKDTKSK
mmetsp:Transcript_15933/g.47918  ORF Transcript_15933/g.47918 Transcript_15933/m.47918 type:complete len:451 (-) Transcript_15933:2211-3563(-)|eukprot:CAMPEP_0206144202 /NCGR_PEP_ID=MMETSP1473-20131121/23344_1 /ASSEMBLY_ACC=CAM_ASM_001109 /TAXON_ID=1461547 /ORGANISM="Stichococcus sp, Strain RCC1054" /LENGTH=450 /DNA_ID=CAMNT_0053539949 /DNA_START=159 /DNA_END=1511 /DNA_ORIENTATION=+